MPVTPVLQLDAVEQAECGFVDGKFYAYRRGWVRNLDTTQASSAILASALAVSGMPQRFDPFPSADPVKRAAIVTRVVVDTDKGVNHRANVLVVYQTPGGFDPSQASAFILERRTFTVTEEWEYHPNGTPLNVSWTHQTSKTSESISTTVKMPFDVPRQILIATGFYQGTPPAVLTTGIPKVNDQTWHGFPIGYWRYDGEIDRTEDYGGSYAVQLHFENRVFHDWSEIKIMEDQWGNRVPVDPTELAAMLAKDYEYGVAKLPAGRTRKGRNAPQNIPNGFIKVGFYKTLNFGNTFGF